MKLAPAPRYYPTNLKRFVSADGVWEVRLDAVMFGCRVHVGRVGAMEFITDYCAGASALWQGMLLGVVEKIVEQQPDGADLYKVDWPQFGRRPMVNDPQCFAKLCRMAGHDRDAWEFMLDLDRSQLDTTDYSIAEYKASREQAHWSFGPEYFGSQFPEDSHGR